MSHHDTGCSSGYHSGNCPCRYHPEEEDGGFWLRDHLPEVDFWYQVGIRAVATTVALVVASLLGVI